MQSIERMIRRGTGTFVYDSATKQHRFEKVTRNRRNWFVKSHVDAEYNRMYLLSGGWRRLDVAKSLTANT